MAATASMATALQVFEKHWGHKSFRKAQNVVIESVLEGKDVLAVLPTGYGKSATFQVPALCRPGCAIVISPLIALMKDQCDDATARGIPASYVNTHVDESEQAERYAALMAGEFKLFYIAPERIRSKSFLGALQASEINCVVVDEAHCASQWGHDFRPMYMRIVDVVNALTAADGTRPPIMAVTATATKGIEADIAKAVGMSDDYIRVVADPVRANLAYEVRDGSPWVNLRVEFKRWNIQTGRYIVYVGTQKGAEMVADMTNREFGQGTAIYYHAGMTRGERIDAQDKFKSGRTPVAVATCAFGMGIDIPNIRSVVHFGYPGCLEDYIQEAGRAGRDGLWSSVVLLADPASIELRQRFLDLNNPPYALFRAVWAWLKSTLDDGEVLKMTAKQIAQAIQAETDYNQTVHEAPLNTVLNILEKLRLIRRGTMPGGTEIVLTPTRFRRALVAGNLDPKTQQVAETIDKHFVEPELTVRKHPEGERLRITLDKRTLAGIARVGEFACSKALKQLEAARDLSIEPTFRGKTCEIIARNADLAKVLPVEEMRQKREREQYRLDKLIEYSRTKPNERIAFIRDYFLNDQAGMLAD